MTTLRLVRCDICARVVGTWISMERRRKRGSPSGDIDVSSHDEPHQHDLCHRCAEQFDEWRRLRREVLYTEDA